MAGLVPAISIRVARCLPYRDRRDKPGDDTLRNAIPLTRRLDGGRTHGGRCRARGRRGGCAGSGRSAIGPSDLCGRPLCGERPHIRQRILAGLDRAGSNRATRVRRHYDRGFRRQFRRALGGFDRRCHPSLGFCGAARLARVHEGLHGGPCGAKGRGWRGDRSGRQNGRRCERGCRRESLGSCRH
jgi:hypothetical protein